MAAETDDPTSLLNYYRTLIALRNGHTALNGGEYRLLLVDGTSFVFERAHADEAIVVAVNYGNKAKSIYLNGLESNQAYSPLFSYGADPVSLIAGNSGSAALSMPGQSIQAFRLARPSTPFGVDMYVRGTMNNWESVDSAKFEYKGSGLYEAKIYLGVGTYAFKIAGTYWEYGFAAICWRDLRTLELGEPFVLEPTAWDGGGSADILHISVLNGYYVFAIDATNVLAPILTVRKAD